MAPFPAQSAQRETLLMYDRHLVVWDDQLRPYAATPDTITNFKDPTTTTTVRLTAPHPHDPDFSGRLLERSDTPRAWCWRFAD